MRIEDSGNDVDPDNETCDDDDNDTLDDDDDNDDTRDDDDDNDDERDDDDASDDDALKIRVEAPPHCSYSTEKGGGSWGIDVAMSRGCSRVRDGGEGDDGGVRRDKRRGQHGSKASEWNMSSV